MAAESIVGSLYSWGPGAKASIRFDASGVLQTPWIVGTWSVENNRNVLASWAGFSHRLTFSEDFASFTSVREKDGDVVKGERVDSQRASKILSVTVNYRQDATDLCWLGQKYNVDKSSQRLNPGPDDSHHCHAYSCLYDRLFRTARAREGELAFCEIGIAEGRSLLMWEEYFGRGRGARIYGFEKWPKWLEAWQRDHGERQQIRVSEMDVRSESSIANGLGSIPGGLDCILDDSSHIFYDMIRIIRTGMKFLKPGGMLLIEDIYKAWPEEWFAHELEDVLEEFQQAFFVSIEHSRQNSGSLRNDKVLVLVKGGAEPIFETRVV